MPAIKGKPVLSRRRRVTLQCSICGSDYDQHEYRAKTSKFCSRDCWSNRSHRECPICKKIFGTVGHFGKTYCSKACSAKGHRGKNHPMWKDGKSLERNRARQSGPLAKWKKLVKKRDGACVRCGEVDHLHSHHIKPFSSNPDLATDPDNGITLCELCHSIEHGRWIGPKSRIEKWHSKTVGNYAV